MQISREGMGTTSVMVVSQGKERVRDMAVKKNTRVLHTSFGDLLQRNGVPSPVVGQVRVGCRVLFLHIESSEEAKLTPAQVFTTHC